MPTFLKQNKRSNWMCSNVPQLSRWIVALLHSHSWTHTMSHSEVFQLCVTPCGRIWYYRSSQSSANYQTFNPKCWRHNQNNTLKYIAKFWTTHIYKLLPSELKYKLYLKLLVRFLTRQMQSLHWKRGFHITVNYTLSTELLSESFMKSTFCLLWQMQPCSRGWW